MGLFQRLSVLALLLMLTGVLITPAVAQSEYCEGRSGGRLAVADAQSGSTSLDPFVSSWHSWPHYAIFPTLFQQALDGSYVGFLADTWEANEDGTELTINLIEGENFTDGTPINAEAIAWNLLRYADPETGASQGADLVGLLEEVEVVDEYTFTMKMSRSFAPLFFVLGNVEIVSPTAYEEMGSDDFAASPVGAGPFILSEFVPGNYALFERNPDFDYAPEEIFENTGPMCVDELQILFLSEEQTILSALETGELTLAPVPTQNLEEIRAQSDITVEETLQNQIRYIGFNTSKAPWDNADLRRALSYATDRFEVAIFAYDDLALPLLQPLPPTIWGHNPELDESAISFDPDRAMEILDEIGYVDVDGDGIRENPDGEPFVVPIETGNDAEWTAIAQIIEGQWGDIGIQVDINLMDFSSMIDSTTTGEHDLFISLYGYSDPLILTYFFDPERKGGSNRAWFSTDELTNLLLEADSDLNQETRYETITEISEYIMDAAPWIFLVTPPNLTGVRAELEGWEINPFNQSFLYYDSYFTDLE